jgi:hypothetical protein
VAKREIVVDLNRVPADKGFELLGSWGGGQNVDVQQMLPMIRLAVQPEYADNLTFLEAFEALQQLSAQLAEVTKGMNVGGKA